jgi:hypothetical protein
MQWRLLVAENPRVALIPYLPSDQQGKRGDDFPIRRSAAHHHLPPSKDRKTGPLPRMYGGDANPPTDSVPKADREPAMDE